LDQSKDEVEKMIREFPERKQIYMEDFQNISLLAIYDDAWDLMQLILKRDEEIAKKKATLSKN